MIKPVEMRTNFVNGNSFSFFACVYNRRNTQDGVVEITGEFIKNAKKTCAKTKLKTIF